MTTLLADFDSDIRTIAALLILGVISTALAIRAASLKRRVFHRRANNWDQVQGRIEHTDVVTEPRGKLDAYVAVIRYSYKVHGEYLSGEYAQDFFRERKAYELIDSIAIGAEVIIRCDPDNVGFSVLREQDNPGLFQPKSSANLS